MNWGLVVCSIVTTSFLIYPKQATPSGLYFVIGVINIWGV
jgi:hypothetical protein